MVGRGEGDRGGVDGVVGDRGCVDHRGCEYNCKYCVWEMAARRVEMW